MNNERYNQIIDEAYEDYLKNFIEPICPPNLDVQPSYYEPMTKDWFVKSAKERGSRGDEFSKKWGLKIEERELSLEERGQWCQDFLDWDLVVGNLDHDHIREDVEENAPAKLITVTYKNEKTEIYE